MKRVLVSGKIGSGKSEACRYFASLGYPVYDCDSRCKALYEEVPGLKRRIEEALGTDFSNLGVIFRDPEKMEKLESIVFPLLIADIAAWTASCEGDAVFIESATALSKPSLSGIYDSVLIVEAPFELRVGRNPKAAQRDALQHCCCPGATVIGNSSDLVSFHNKLDDYLKTI